MAAMTAPCSFYRADGLMYGLDMIIITYTGTFMT